MCTHRPPGDLPLPVNLKRMQEEMCISVYYGSNAFLFHC